MTQMIEQGRLVDFQVSPIIKGRGKVCGIATSEQPLIGRGIIIELLQSEGIDHGAYPFSHMTIFECQITNCEAFRA